MCYAWRNDYILIVKALTLGPENYRRLFSFADDEIVN